MIVYYTVYYYKFVNFDEIIGMYKNINTALENKNHFFPK